MNSGQYCCANCLQRDATVQCGHGCGAALYCGQECANEHYDIHESLCIDARARGGRRPVRGKRAQGKVHKVMEEYEKGELHSGSKTGPVVRNRKQAVAIALAEARRGKK